MSARQYRTRKGMHPEVAGHALEVLAELADGRAYPPEVNTEQTRAWAQVALDQMVARGYIEPKDEAL
jgi:hypothetical protein